jgi:hypothetical protein
LSSSCHLGVVGGMAAVRESCGARVSLQAKVVLEPGRFSSALGVYAGASAPLVELRWPGGHQTLCSSDVRKVRGYASDLATEAPQPAAREQHRLQGFVEWVRSLSFPQVVYRGVSLPAGVSLELDRSPQSWTTDEHVALSSSRRMVGRCGSAQLLTGRVARPEDIYWPQTLDRFLRYSLGLRPEHALICAEACVLRVQEVYFREGQQALKSSNPFADL